MSAPAAPNVTSFAPQEPYALEVLERTDLIEQYFVAIGYGVVLTVYLATLPNIVSFKRTKKTQWAILTYCSIMLLFATMFVVGDMVLVLKAWVDNRNFPGGGPLPPGPAGYVLFEFSHPQTTLANVAYTLQSWFADSLMIYRCLVVFSMNYWVIAFPVLILLGSFSMGTLLLVEVCQPNNSLWTKVSTNFAIPFFSLSISLNFIVTLLIVGRLLTLRNRVKDTLGANHCKHYVSISSMLVESATLTTVTSLLFLVPYARGQPVANVFQGLSCQMQITASLLIILRVSQGRAWSKGTVTAMNVPSERIQFKTGSKPSNSNLRGTADTYAMSDIQEKGKVPRSYKSDDDLNTRV